MNHLQLLAQMVVSLFSTVNRPIECAGRMLVSLHLLHHVLMSQVFALDFYEVTEKCTKKNYNLLNL